jgi:heme-degrading monooxygenase HmoA
MVIAIITFPPIKPGKDGEFIEWFTGTNIEFAGHKGLIRRRLLKPLDGGNYSVMVEHESFETFIAGVNNPEHEKAGRQMASFFDGDQTPLLYEVLVG